MMTRIRFAGLAVAALALLATVAATARAAPAADRVVVMVSVDGLAGYYLDDPKAEMPNIRRLAAEGARASGMEAVAPTVTWPNHVTLVTGDFPARHGVVGNNYFDRATGKRVALVTDPTFDKDQIVHVPTVYDVAHAAGMATAAVRWPATRNAHALDWTVPDCGTNALLLRYTTPALLAECVAAGIEPPAAPDEATAEADPDDKKVTKRFGDASAVATFDLILRRHHPRLGLVHVSDVDHTEHLHGPRTPEAYAAVKRADAQVGEVWAELQRDAPGRAAIVIVSDHGFSRIEHAILPNVILRDAGLVTVKGTRQVGGAVRLVPQGGSALVYVTDAEHKADVVARVTKAFAGVRGVEKVVGPGQTQAYGIGDPAVDPHAPDMILFADDGYSFGDTAAGVLSFLDKPEVHGTHGHDPHLPILRATFVAAGAGIRPGVSLGLVRNVDVAPTVAALLGLSMGDTDGRPLTAILADGVPSAAKP